jgi:hypothetical protein
VEILSANVESDKCKKYLVFLALKICIFSMFPSHDLFSPKLILLIFRGNKAQVGVQNSLKCNQNEFLKTGNKL